MYSCIISCICMFLGIVLYARVRIYVYVYLYPLIIGSVLYVDHPLEYIYTYTYMYVLRKEKRFWTSGRIRLYRVALIIYSPDDWSNFFCFYLFIFLCHKLMNLIMNTINNAVVS